MNRELITLHVTAEEFELVLAGLSAGLDNSRTYANSSPPYFHPDHTRQRMRASERAEAFGKLRARLIKEGSRES